MENLLETFAELKEDLKNLETKLFQISSKNYILDNKILEENFNKLQKENSELKEKLKKLEEEKAKIQMALITSAYTEKTIILNNEIKKIKNIISNKIDTELQKIEEMKSEINSEVEKVQKKIRNENIELKEKLTIKLEDFKKENLQILANSRKKIEEQKQYLFDEQLNKLEAYKNEEIPQNILQNYFNKRNFERLVGLNLINKLGILMIIIGVIVLSKYSIGLISNLMKGIIIFLIGGSMFFTGEILSKNKKTTVFSIGLLSGGIGVIYAGVAISFFMLNILSSGMAMGLYILISILGIILSLKHNSQAILIFTLIGGYLPFFYLLEDKTYSNILYLFFAGFSMYSFLISFKKKWLVTNYLGFFLNALIISMLPVVIFKNSTTKDYIIAFIYIIYSFIIYSLIPIISNYKLKESFKALDVLLIAINTFVSSIFLYGLFYFAGWNNFYGLLAIVLGVLYVFFAKGLERKFPIADNIIILFYLTGLTFVALVIPLQLGKMWVTLGWLLEGIILLNFGLLSQKKEFEKFGIILCTLAGIYFMGFDVFISSKTSLFLLKYTAVTFSLIYAVWLYIKYKSNFKIPIHILKIIAVVNVILYLRYVLLYNYEIFGMDNYKLQIYFKLLWIGMIYFIGLFITNNLKIKDKYMDKLSLGIYGIGLLNISFLLIFGKLSYSWEYSIVIWLKLIIGIWIAIGLLSRTLKELEINLNYYPVIVAVYLIFTFIRAITLYLNIEFFSLVITVLIFIYSIILIGIGFIKSYYYLRKTGLIFIFLGMIKLFIFDFIILSPVNKVISYFALGISLIAVSYIYQYFDKKFVLNIQEENK